MVNGNTWPFQVVEQRRYRLRFLNGCQSRFLILDFAHILGVEVWPIGNEGGFLAAPVNLTATNGNRLLMGLAERADLIVDFTNVPVGSYVLGNLGPDEPFGGGDGRPRRAGLRGADPDTTGQVLQFRVVPRWPRIRRRRRSTSPCRRSPHCPPATVTRPLALIEMMSTSWDGPCRSPCWAPWMAMLGMSVHVPVPPLWWNRSPRTPPSATPRSGSSTTSPPTPTPCMSTRPRSR